MQKRRKNKFRLMRPTDALLPIAFLIAGLLGHGQTAAEVFFALVVVRLLALASATGVRAAFAERPSLRGTRETVKLALLLQPVGGILAAILWRVCPEGWLPAHAPWLIGTALLLNIERVFYEYMYAVGQGDSAALGRLITSMLMAAGLIMGGDAPATTWPCGAAALSAIVSAVVGLTIGGRLKSDRGTGGKDGFNPLAALRRSPLLKRAPMALLQAALYPALAFLLWHFRPFGGAYWPIFAGWAAFELCRAPFRRSPSESRTMNRALAIACGAMLLVTLLCRLTLLAQFAVAPDIALAGCMGILGGLCGFGLYGNVTGNMC